MKITQWESRNMSSKLFMKYGKDFALTEKNAFRCFARWQRSFIYAYNETENSRFVCL